MDQRTSERKSTSRMHHRSVGCPSVPVFENASVVPFAVESSKRSESYRPSIMGVLNSLPMLSAPFEAIDCVWALPVLEIDPDAPPICGKLQIGPWICGLPPILNSPAHFDKMSVSSNCEAPQARCA